MKRVVFFNYFHNGDIHVSRGFVRQIMNKIHQQDSSIQFSYGHKNDPSLLSDIPNLSFDSSALAIVNDSHVNLRKIGDTIYINTWYAQQNFKYMNTFGLTFDALYASFDENCQHAFGFSLSEISMEPKDFYPIIDYSKFEISRAQQWINENSEKKILVENGHSLSGQSDNFNMTLAIANIAIHHMDKIFIISNQDNIPLPNNCIYAAGIIKKNGRSDLNEISFLSTHCDIIIGRASGVWSFALTKQNLFERTPKFIGFYNLPFRGQDYWLGSMFKGKINYSANFHGHDENNLTKIQNIIQQNL